MILAKLQQIFRDIFDDEELLINQHTTSDDIKEWDSFATISLIAAVSEEFNINIGLNEVEQFKDVKSIEKLIQNKIEKGTKST